MWRDWREVKKDEKRPGEAVLQAFSRTLSTIEKEAEIKEELSALDSDS